MAHRQHRTYQLHLVRLPCSLRSFDLVEPRHQAGGDGGGGGGSGGDGANTGLTNFTSSVFRVHSDRLT